ncbi:helix-turn-helix domain-containing protein [Rhodoferax sp.]|uniref:helix-turn-helix domain-containing protein n=1 Tax=Rhodoferax sp. TaxID=50421 RepID=UPI00374D4D14
MNQQHPLPTPREKRRALQGILKAHPGITCAAQCQRIRAALGQFSLTTFEAMRYLDCYDPRARVMQLRNAGERIATYWRTVTTESGDRHRVGLYVLETAGGAM